MQRWRTHFIALVAILLKHPSRGAVIVPAPVLHEPAHGGLAAGVAETGSGEVVRGAAHLAEGFVGRTVGDLAGGVAHGCHAAEGIVVEVGRPAIDPPVLAERLRYAPGGG